MARNWPKRWRGPSTRLIALLLAMTIAGTTLPVRAQEVTAVPADAAPEGTVVPVDWSGEDLDVLMAPVALFPDPLLAAVLQASVVPLDVVMAARFLDDYAKDPTREPEPNWDPAVRGLLAFPTVLHAMNENLDWVQAVGTAVVQRLPDVQDSIQQVRSELQAGGVLVSNPQQTVEVDGDIIRVTPTDPNTIYVPVYDPAALVEAIRSEDAARSTAGPATEAGPPPVAATPEAAPAPATTAAPPASPAEAPPPATASATTNVTIAPPPAEAPAGGAQASAPPPPAPAYPAPAAYAPPVTYAAPVVYEQPTSSSSTWSTVGTFAGGALVGGILGYAIGDDDDDDHGGWHPDHDDVDDTIDQIDRDRDDARRDRQDYADRAREDRQDFKNEAREDRQNAASNAASQHQQSKAQRDEQRRAQAKNAQAQLGERAQGSVAKPPPRATRTPTPAARQPIQATRSGPTPQLKQAGATPPRNPQATQALPSRSQPAKAAPARATGHQAAPARQGALSGVRRGETAKREQVRGAQSRQAAGRAPAHQAAKSRPAPHVASAPSRGGGQHALSGAGHGGRSAHHAERGRASRRR